MDEKFVTVQQLVDHFNLKVITGDEKALKRKITVPDTNRPGLELSGYFDHTQLKRIVILGNKELRYIETITEDAQRSSFDFLTSEESPAIIISRGFKCPSVLKEIAQKKNYPVLSTDSATHHIIIDLVTYLDEQLAPMISLHGVLLSIYGKGVLLTGESGMGKSELALELIKKGHLLVADDRVDCYRMHNSIFGQSPIILREMLEIRGIGIISVTKMFGVSSVLENSKIDLNIHLEPWSPEKDYDRVGIEDKKHLDIMDVDIPKIVLPVKEGRSMATIIESAVTNFQMSIMGMDSAKEFEQRVLDFIESNKR